MSPQTVARVARLLRPSAVGPGGPGAVLGASNHGHRPGVYPRVDGRRPAESAGGR
jgi:hypothetical protein